VIASGWYDERKAKSRMADLGFGSQPSKAYAETSRDTLGSMYLEIGEAIVGLSEQNID
jgi:hypothetical protein